MPLQNSFGNILVTGLKTSFGGDATGDLYYRDANGFFTRLPIGANGSFLGVVVGLPAFYDAPTARNNLGLGTVATLNTGTGAGNVPVLDGSGKLASSTIPDLALNTIQVVANQSARLALANVQPGDCAKQTDNGLTYMLSALPASTDGNWITIGDTSITAAEIVSGVIAPARLGSGTPSASNWLRGDGSWQTLPYQGITFQSVTGTAANLAANSGYRPNNTALCTLTLPTSCPVDSIIRIVGSGTGGWRVAQNASQQIFFGNLSTTSGTGGRLDSTHERDCIELLCVTANTTFQVISSIGNIDVI